MWWPWCVVAECVVAECVVAVRGTTMPEAASVQVFVRFRPLNGREKALGANTDFLKLSLTDVGLEDDGKPHDFTFDGVMPVLIEQQAMYEMVGRPTVKESKNRIRD